MTTGLETQAGFNILYFEVLCIDMALATFASVESNGLMIAQNGLLTLRLVKTTGVCQCRMLSTRLFWGETGMHSRLLLYWDVTLALLCGDIVDLHVQAMICGDSLQQTSHAL